MHFRAFSAFQWNALNRDLFEWSSWSPLVLYGIKGSDKPLYQVNIIVKLSSCLNVLVETGIATRCQRIHGGLGSYTKFQRGFRDVLRYFNAFQCLSRVSVVFPRVFTGFTGFQLRFRGTSWSFQRLWNIFPTTYFLKTNKTQQLYITTFAQP